MTSTTTKPQGIIRFRAAQDRKWSGIVQEISRAQKQTHWMWFVFPQLRVFAKSETAYHFGLADKDEALAFLADDVLRIRLATATLGILNQRRLMFSGVDQRKLHRSVTLFAELVKDRTLLDKVLAKWFKGEPHQQTLDVLAGKHVEPLWKPGQVWTEPLPTRPWRPSGWAPQDNYWQDPLPEMPLRSAEEPMSHREIQSFLKGLGLTGRQVDKVVDRWMEDQNTAQELGWSTRDEED